MGVAGMGAAGTGVAGMGAAGTGAAGMGAAGTGVAGMGAAGTGVAVQKPTGRSPGCGMAPQANDKAGSFTGHEIMVPACTGAVSSKCVSPMFAPGGPLSQTNGNYSFIRRHYALMLPTSYDVNKAYTVIIGGGGCGGGPTESGGGFSAGQGAADAIRIGLSYVKMCFADGGNSCAGTPANQPQCVNTPEVPYFYAVLNEIESRYCIDKAKVYMGGYSSGGWDSFTLGCAAADVIKGIATVNGGLRNNRPACTGPVAALMVAGEADKDNPIGPLVKDMAFAPAGLSATEVNGLITNLDSNGTAPARDAILARNGCTGTETAVYDPAYPLCKKYTGCPAATPVVWCAITGAGHAPLSYQGVNYVPGSVAGNSLMWKFLTSLP
jgi:poly(3-hydroxybutyrate) depolymerase